MKKYHCSELILPEILSVRLGKQNIKRNLTISFFSSNIEFIQFSFRLISLNANKRHIAGDYDVITDTVSKSIK